MTTTYYGDVASYDAYNTTRGYAISSDATAKQAAIMLASEWIDNNFREIFPGYKTGLRPQVREWPRTAAWDENGYTIATDEIPDEVQRATYEVANRHIASPGSLNTDVIMSEDIKQVTVVGAVQVVYRGALSPDDAQIVMPVVQRILSPICNPEGQANLFNGIFGKAVRAY